jgi:DNA topoisomerase-1
VTEQLAEDAPSSAKPRTASLLKSMDLDSVTLDDALRLLTLPRTLGEIDGESVTVQNGRYGPYVKKGADSRSLEAEDQMFTVTLDEAKELFAQPKPRGRAARAAAAPPLRELGDDTVSGKPIVLRDGRFGPYVTDGETNASLRKGDMAESITPQRAIELLAERRAAAPAPRRTARSSPRSGGSSSRSGTAKTSAKTSTKTSAKTSTKTSAKTSRSSSKATGASGKKA